jgi:hypothetical protein
MQINYLQFNAGYSDSNPQLSVRGPQVWQRIPPDLDEVTSFLSSLVLAIESCTFNACEFIFYISSADNVEVKPQKSV